MTEQEIQTIDKWINRLYPKRFKFWFLDEYYFHERIEYKANDGRYLPDENLLLQNGIIIKVELKNEWYHHLTPLAIEIYEAKGLKKHQDKKNNKRTIDKVKRYVLKPIGLLLVFVIPIYATLYPEGAKSKIEYVCNKVCSLFQSKPHTNPPKNKPIEPTEVKKTEYQKATTRDTTQPTKK